MKKIICLAMLGLFLIGCADSKNIDGITYQPVGVIHEFNGAKDPCIRYDLSPGNLFWAIVLVETIVAPIYFIGWSLFEPIDKIPSCKKI